MINLILLQAQTNPETGKWNFWIMLLLIGVVFYFFMIRPQSKKQKELQKQRDALNKGDKIVTAGGVHGIIKDIETNTFLIEIAKETTIRIDKSSVFPYQNPNANNTNSTNTKTDKSETDN